LKAQILEFDRRILAWHRSSATSKRLDAIPGVGPALATALVASIADPKAFRSGRDISAWAGLVPKQNSSGRKDKLGSISKQGDRYLRSLFVFRRGVSMTIGVGVPSSQFNEINDLKGSRRRRWGSFFDQHSHPRRNNSAMNRS